MREIYLDNAATTPCDPRVVKVMKPYWSGICGNPSSFNDAGRKAKKALSEAKNKIARILGAKNQEVIFTSSATEANNLAIFGTTEIKDGKCKIITTKIEHHSVLEPIKKIKERGAEILYLSVNKDGLIKLDELKKVLTPDTALISIIYANNEIGSVQPIKKIAKIIKEFKIENLKLRIHEKTPFFHVDASQAAAHLDINVNSLGVDLMTLSSHKIYGPRGIAALYLRQGTRIEPIMEGGGQEFGLRPGTEAVPLIVGFAKALEITNNKKEASNRQQEKLRDFFVAGLNKIFPAIQINGPENHQNRTPHIINMTFPGIENEQLLLYLDKYGVRAAAGSACASKDIEPSHVLLAVGLSKKDARSSIRFSLGRQTEKKELDYVLKILPKIINKIKSLYPDELKKYYYAKVL